MSGSIVDKARITNLLHRQIKWLTDAELTDLAEQFDFEESSLHGGWTFCHHIVHKGYLRPFVNFCKNKFDTKVKKRQNPPKDRLRDVVRKTLELGSNENLRNEAFETFARSVDWQSYSEFQKQKGVKNRDLTDDEKCDILVARYESGVLQSKILDSFRWRNFWLIAVDTIYSEVEREEDLCDFMGYGF